MYYVGYSASVIPNRRNGENFQNCIMGVSGILALWNSGIRYSAKMGRGNSRNHTRRNSGNLEFWDPTIWESDMMELWHYGTQEFWDSGITGMLGFWDSEIL